MSQRTNDREAQERSLFRDHAALYARFRPTYPSELFDYLVDVASPCRLALDCATGNGQAAVDLCERVDRVIAVDVSDEQLEHAKSHPNVEYRRAPAEATGLPENSVDLVTAAAALHWFDLEPFYEHLEKIVPEGGIVAAWSYGIVTVDEEVDAILRHLKNRILGEHWDSRLEHNWNEYETIPFPFDELDPPSFESRMEWNLEEFLGFALTWSGVQQHLATTGENPIDAVRSDLEEAWGDPERVRTVRLPLFSRVGVA